MSNDLITMKDVYRTYKIAKRQKGIIQTVAHMIRPQYEIKKAVNELSFSIKEGEMVGFVGPNGSGKSTTVKMLSGILYPDQGSIEVAGCIPYKQRREYVQKIGVVFGQKSQLAWDLPCVESFELLKHVYRIPEEVYQKNLRRYTEILEMDSFIEQPVRQLSLGQRMRADIAAALLHSPKIVFFDEPTIGVDVVGKEKIRNFLVELNRQDNLTMLFTTHDMKDIEKTCNRLMIIDQGTQIYDGGIEEIKQHYGSKRVLDILLEEHQKIQPIEKVDSKYVVDGGVEKLRLTFQKQDVNVNVLMRQVLDLYQVRDLSLVEPDVEEIIRNIYEGEA